MSANGPETLPVHCPECGQPMTVEYVPDDRLVRPENVFPCPHCWAETAWLSLPGRLTDAWKGHGPAPDDAS